MITMRIATTSPPSTTTLDRTYWPLMSSQSTTPLSWERGSSRDQSTTTTLVGVRMRMERRRKSWRDARDTHRYNINYDFEHSFRTHIIV